VALIDIKRSGRYTPEHLNSRRPHTPRGSLSNPAGRFERRRIEGDDPDAIGDWGAFDEEERDRRPATVVGVENCKSIVTENDSPDVPFDRSINPYKGCEHGCVYCFARPTHGYLGLSSGIDFETRIFDKPNAASLLREHLDRPSYRCEPIALGANTDPYQPIERELRTTRSILEVLAERNHPVGLITKSHGVLRDVDLLSAMAARNLVHVMVSVTTLDPDLARRMEPRASTPMRRLAAISGLARAGVPVGVLASPMIPALNDHELERILEACRTAGATRAGTILIRLPHEVKELFDEWLAHHYPDRREHVLRRIREARGGKLYDSRFGTRLRGEGKYAEMIRARFETAARRLGFDRDGYPFDTSQFRPPSTRRQLELFGARALSGVRRS
jgi:DNA repair photolyase